jgi:hypothetical protein
MLPKLRSAEINEAEVHRLFHLLSVRSGEDDIRNVGLEQRDRVCRFVRIKSPWSIRRINGGSEAASVIMINQLSAPQDELLPSRKVPP